MELAVMNKKTSMENSMKNLSLFHNFCVDTFGYILSQRNVYEKGFGNPIFNYALKDSLVGQYAETYCINDEEMKFWDVNWSQKKHKQLNEWRVLLASENAIKGIERIKNGDMEYTKKEDDCPYYEHIEPKSVTYNKLMQITDPTKEKILKAFQYCKVIMITEEESKFLDSKEYSLFTKEDEARLESWKNKEYITSDIYEESISSMKTNNEYVSSRDKGNAYSRLAHLIEHGVKFQWKCNPKTPRDQGELISQYLESNERNYSLK